MNRPLLRSCARPGALALAGLGVLPPALLSEAAGWDFTLWQGHVAELLWLPATLSCLLRLLGGMGRALNPAARPPAVTPALLGRALSAELLLSLRFCAVALLCLTPGLALMSLLGLDTLAARAAFMALALAGAVPALLWILRRLFSAPVVLWQGLSGGAALAESARLTKGKLGSVLPVLLLAGGLGLAMQLLSEASLVLGLLLLPLAFLINSAALAWAYAKLTL